MGGNQQLLPALAQAPAAFQRNSKLSVFRELLNNKVFFFFLQCPFDHWLYRSVSLLNLASFVPCRFLSLAYIFYGMWTMGHRVAPLFLRLLFASCCVMAVINCGLFWRLFKNDVIKPCFERAAGARTSRKVAVNGTSEIARDRQVTLTNGERLPSQHNHVDSTSEGGDEQVLRHRTANGHSLPPANGSTVTSSICD